MPRTELAGITVLVTRPVHQAGPLCDLIEAAGGQAIRLPLLAIHDTSHTPAVAQRLSRLCDYDLAIFVSPNAVRYGLGRGTELPHHLQFAAVGKGTARELQQRIGQRPVIVPGDRFDSEGLLALPELHQVDGKRVLIFRGNGGRELLAETLRLRGARVDYAEVYRRECPPNLAREDERLVKADIIVLTSCEGLENLVAISAPSQRTALFTKPLLLVSARAVELARTIGFHGECLLSPRATEDAIIETLTQWAGQRTTTTEAIK